MTRILFEQLSFSTFLVEANNIEKLKKNKVPLTDEERKQCLDANASYNGHPDKSKNPIAAVWKSKDEKGNITYVTSTHRAYSTAPTLKGAIKKWHTEIKETG